MSILIDEHTRVLIQGITGKEGRRAAEEILSYGTKILAGVTPGKSGENVCGIPVYDSVKEALREYPDINASFLAVPASAVKSAATDAIRERIPLVNIFAEHVPVQDSAVILALARQAGVTLVGPSSVGIISPGKGKIGSIGNESISRVFTQGHVGIISKSGGMTSEIALTLSSEGIGQSTALCIGGDQIIGFDFVDALALFEKDTETKAVVLFGEVGGTYEEQAADFIKKAKCTKPVIALIAGKFSAALREGVVLGHAGAIVERGRGGYESKVSALSAAGVAVADTLDEIPLLLSHSISATISS